MQTIHVEWRHLEQEGKTGKEESCRIIIWQGQTHEAICRAAECCC
jgi:hypothetical protein